jgi:porin
MPSDARRSEHRSTATVIAAFLALGALPAVASDCAEAVDADCSVWNIDVAYTADLWRNASGGIERGSAYLDGLDLAAAVDAERAFGWRGVRLYGHVQYNNGAEFSGSRVGDAQAVSNLEGVGTWRLYEFWADFALGDGHAAQQSLRFGLYDLNSEFDSIDTAGLFLNASHGIGPEYAQSGLNGPSIFPVTSLALRLRRESARGYWQLALLDAVPGSRSDPGRSGIYLDGAEGALLAAEWGLARGRLSKFALGAWGYTARFDTLDETDPLTGAAVRARGNHGVYALADVVVHESDSRRVDAFVRAGIAESRFNGVADYVGAGLVVHAPLRARPDDQFGIAVASAGAGTDLRRAGAALGAPLDRRETSFELTYRLAAADWLTLQPNLQYISNPGFDPGLGNAWVMGLRIEFGAGWAR